MYQLEMQNHEGFQRLVYRTTLGAAVAAMVGHLIARWLSLPPEWGLGVGIGAALTLARRGFARGVGQEIAIAFGTGILATVVGLAGGRWAGGGTDSLIAGAGLYGLVLGFSAVPGLRGWRRLAPLASTAVFGVLGFFVAARLMGAMVEAAPGMPVAVEKLGIGLLAGLFLALGDLGARVAITRDAVITAFAATEPVLRGELRGLAEQAMKTRSDIGLAIQAAKSEPDGAARVPAELKKHVDEVVLRTFSLGRRCADLDAEVARTPVEELCARLEKLDEKIAACTDHVAVDQYKMAKAALATQLGYRQQIEVGRERVVARLHNDLAELEKVRLALVRARSMDAHTAAEALAPLVERLRSVGEDLDATSDAIGEASQIIPSRIATTAATEAAPVAATAPAAEPTPGDPTPPAAA